VDTERSNIGSGLTFNPDDTKIAFLVKLQEFGFVNGSYAELSFDGGNKGRTLKERSREGFDGAMKFFGIINGRVKTNDTDVFFSSALLCLDESRGTINANN